MRESKCPIRAFPSCAKRPRSRPTIPSYCIASGMVTNYYTAGRRRYAGSEKPLSVGFREMRYKATRNYRGLRPIHDSVSLSKNCGRLQSLEAYVSLTKVPLIDSTDCVPV